MTCWSVRHRPTFCAILHAEIDQEGALSHPHATDFETFGLILAVSQAARAEMQAEIEAQFCAFLSTGLILDQVNVRQHFPLHPIAAAIVIAIGQKLGARALRVPRAPARLVHAGEAP